MPERRWYKGHGLGNDYLVFEDTHGGWPLTSESVRTICHGHEGVGGDGIVVLLDREPEDGIFPLRMFNPDGSEFERSGNGLRVLGAHLHREGLVNTGEPFHVRSGGAEITMVVNGSRPDGVRDISVEMGEGRMGWHAGGIRNDALDPDGGVVHPEWGRIPIHVAWVGNPHTVVFLDEWGGADELEEAIEVVGPFLTNHPAFPAGTNVQVAQVGEAGRLGIAIWERGVGRTSASGTSSCAAAVAAVSTGRIPPGWNDVTMAGGILQVRVGEGREITLRGPVTSVATGELTEGMAYRLSHPEGEVG